MLAPLAGLLLATLMLPQTIGLLSTTASKSGFLTSLYVLFVPLLGWAFFKYKIHLKMIFYTGIGLLGTSLMVGLHRSSEPINIGDLWTILCALGAAAHIIYIGIIAVKIQDGFRFNNLQSLFCLLFLVPFLESPTEFVFRTPTLLALLGLITLAVGSSVIAFAIQVRAQKVLSPTTASMMFLLESPFAMLFGIILLQDQLTLEQGMGSLLIIASALLMLKFDASRNNPNHKN